MAPADLARAVEERGFDSLYLPEHTHLPVRADTPPALVEGVHAEDYRRSLDPFVALSMAAAVTTRINLGTGVVLAAQHDPIVLVGRGETLGCECVDKAHARKPATPRIPEGPCRLGGIRRGGQDIGEALDQRCVDLAAVFLERDLGAGHRGGVGARGSAASVRGHGRHAGETFCDKALQLGS